jgi:glycosyltransferase involved in cell wall biosynthesis
VKPVLHVITTICRGGAENQLLTLIREQVSTGRKVELIFLKDQPELLGELCQMGVEVHSEFSMLSPLAQLVSIRRFLKGKEVLIHGHLPRAELIAALSKGGNALVVTRHNAEKFFPSAPKFLSSALSRYVIRRSNAIIAISQSVSDFLHENKELPKNVKPAVVYYGYQSNSQHADLKKLRESLNIPLGAIVIGTVARLTTQKDLPTLLHAFASLKSNENLRLLMVGDGPLRDELKSMAIELDIRDQVIWAGRTDKVFAHLNLMDIFVLTSTYEGFGLVLLEALEAHLPVIASNVSAVPEVLGPNYPGLVEPGNSQAFAEKITEFILLDSVDKERIENTGQSRLAFFSAVKMRQKIDEVYAS